MGRLRFTGLVAALVACAALCAPVAASAASSFSWSPPGDFTATGSGSNPEHKYGDLSWSYSAPTAGLVFSSSFAGDGGMFAGWSDSSAWIAVPATGNRPTLQMVPAQGGSVALTWVSPFPGGAQVTISGTVTEPDYSWIPTQCAGTSWTLRNGSAVVASGSGASGTISPGGPVTVAGGGTLVFTTTDVSVPVVAPYSTACDDTEVALSLSAPAPASAITLTSPTSNQSFTSGQPTLTGAAGDGFGYDGQVKVNVYSGGAATGTPLQTLTTTERSGSWSVPANALANGTYTAQAEQDDVLGDADLSAAVTFTVANPGAPTVTLNSLGSAPLRSSTPTMTGTGGTAAGDSDVDVTISSGPVFSESTVVRFLPVPVGPGGGFTVAVAPALPGGQYTAVALQLGPGEALGESAPVTFQIEAHPAVLTLTSPPAGSSLGQSAETFSGAAGTVSGDANTVRVTLWRGDSTKGKPLGSEQAKVSNSTWTVTWSKRLPLGLYTVQASQLDEAGHTAITAAHTFLVVPTPSTIGSSVDLARSGVASVPITCFAPASGACIGKVLVVTVRSFRPVPGGPTGSIRVLFADVDIPGGHTVVIRRRLRGSLTRLLRRHAPLQVRVTATLSTSGAAAATDVGTRTLRAPS